MYKGKIVYDIVKVMSNPDNVKEFGAYMLQQTFNTREEAIEEFKNLAKEEGAGEKGYILEMATPQHETIARIATLDYDYGDFKTTREVFMALIKLQDQVTNNEISVEEYIEKMSKYKPTLRINKKYIKNDK